MVAMNAWKATVFVTSRGASDRLRVRDLAAGSGIHFAARGKQKLRGVEGEYDLFAVED
jgi:hypothetical protein